MDRNRIFVAASGEVGTTMKKICAASLLALALAGCQSTSTRGALESAAAQSSSPNVRYFSYSGSDVALSWTASTATLNYDAQLAMSNSEIAELVESETGCETGNVGMPTLVGSRVHLQVAMTCPVTASDNAGSADDGQAARRGGSKA
jgi:hypothetical protein